MNKRTETFHDLVVWQKSHDLTRQIYQKTAKFPRKEMTLMAPQIRNVAVQLPINIAIGFNKRSKKAKVHYYRTALTAVEEIKYYLELAQALGIYKNADENVNDYENIERMLKRLIRSNLSGKD